MDHGGGRLDAALLAAGERSGPAVEEAGQAQRLGDLVDGAGERASAQAVQAAEQAQGLAGRGGGVQREVLRGQAEPVPRGAGRGTVDAHVPGIGARQAGDDVGERGLSRSVVPDEADDLAGSGTQGESVQGADGSQRLDQG